MKPILQQINDSIKFDLENHFGKDAIINHDQTIIMHIKEIKSGDISILNSIEQLYGVCIKISNSITGLIIKI